MKNLPAKFNNLFSKIKKQNGFYEVNVNSRQIDLVLDLLRLDKDYQEYLFDHLFRDYRILNQNVMRPEQHTHFQNFIYRGQMDFTWGLIPGSFRNFVNDEKSYTQQEIENLLNFIRCTDELNIQIPSDSSSLRNHLKKILAEKGNMACNNWINEVTHEMLGYAQHYGAVTRLLDWSYNPLVSLYFSSIGLLKAKTKPKYFSLYILNIDYLKIKNPEKDLVSVLNIPKGLNKHISYQNGCFTLVEQEDYRNSQQSKDFLKKLGMEKDLTPKHINDVLSYHNQDYCLLKINFHKNTAQTIFKYCNSMGINASSIYEPGEALKNRIEEIKFTK
ncbi:FRG domain-containing protein [Acinetobacter bereziniae]|uniref:FRG domain-containing protein n=1 Tax=Acinetobacter bereziniae TaxID=106648 RepID=UPI00300AE465